MEAEDEAGTTLDPTHVGFMRDDMIGRNVGIISRAQTTDQIGTLVVAAEAAIKIGVMVEVLVAAIISIPMVVDISKIIIKIIIKDQFNNTSSEKATIMIRVDHP